MKGNIIIIYALIATLVSSLKVILTKNNEFVKSPAEFNNDDRKHNI
jgi:hypothetical protein